MTLTTNTAPVDRAIRFSLGMLLLGMGAYIPYVDHWAFIAAPIVAVPIAIITPIAAVGDALGGLFGGGSSGPPEPNPLPGWMDAGAVGSFSVVIRAPASTGTHAWTVEIVGDNYDNQRVTYVLHVEEDD